MKVAESIEDKLQRAFQPAHLSVNNESEGHNVPIGSETHFNVVVVSAAFGGKRLVQRHQAVYAALSDEMNGGVHALALHTYTPEEWRDAEVQASPPCLGGGKAA